MIASAIRLILTDENDSDVGVTEQIVSVKSGGFALAGSVTQPAGRGPRPAALLLSGSGPLDRDSNMPAQRLDISKALALGLAERGIVSLRYDKRGVGASEGDFVRTGFDDETADAVAALAELRAHPMVDPDRVAVVGHSVGAILAVRLAATGSPPSGCVLLAGTTMSGERVMTWQSDRIAATLPRFLGLLRGPFIRRQRRQREGLAAATTDAVRLGRTEMSGRWFREYMAYDPAVDLAAVDVPVLALTGEKDVQVDPADVALIGSLVNGPFEGEVVPDLTHLLRRDGGRPGLLGYRRQLRRPTDPWVVTRVADWVANLPARPDP
jgi:pimeloyl-ACP methyl ester carboxylesterase